MEIKVLGTVAPYPKGNLNCSSFLVSEGESKILLDAGFGCSKELDIMRDLKNLTIVISHFHPDHYGDLLAIANQTYIAKKLGFLDEPIDVYLPVSNENAITNNELDDKTLLATNSITSRFLTQSGDVNYFRYHCYNESTSLNIGEMTITFKKTIHPIDTYAVKVKNKDNIGLVYSSDTGYENNGISEFANNESVLICEATYLKGQKTGNDHLLASEAGKIAYKAGVKNLCLFHTFPEIDKQEYVDEAKEYFENTSYLEEGDVITLEEK